MKFFLCLLLLTSVGASSVRSPDSPLAIALNAEAQAGISINQTLAALFPERADYFTGKADAFREVMALVKIHERALWDRPIETPSLPKPDDLP